MAQPEMDPQHEAIIQRMIDGGESEDNIASVIRLMATAPKPVAASEPDTYWGGALKGAKEGVVGGATGFVKGIGPGLVEGAKGVVTGPIALAKGAYNAATDPSAAASGAWDAIKNAPKTISDTVSAAATKAAIDPEGFGNDVGRITGAVEGGILAGKAIPLGVKPMARTVGKGLEYAGQHPFATRMSGGAGVVAGVATGRPELVLGGLAAQALPGMATKAGQALRIYGGEPQAVVRLGAKGVSKLTSQFDEAMVKRGMEFADEQAAVPLTLQQKLEKAVASGQLRRGTPAGPATSIRERAAAAAGEETLPIGARPSADAPKGVRILGKAAVDLERGAVAPKPVVGPASTLDDLATKIGTGVNEEAAVANMQRQTENSSRLAMDPAPGLAAPNPEGASKGARAPRRVSSTKVSPTPKPIGRPYTEEIRHVTTPESAAGIRTGGFDVNRSGGLGGDTYGPGAYLGDARSDVAGYWRSQLETKNATGTVPTEVMKGKAALKNALVVEDIRPGRSGPMRPLERRDIVAQHLPKQIDTFDALVKSGTTPNQALGQVVRDAGHDGLVLQRASGDEVVAFNAEGVNFEGASGTKAARIATQEGIPASKSKSPMSATPGLTRADLESVKLNPDLNYKNLTEAKIAEIKANRSSRHGTAYANARTDASLRAGRNDLKSILMESLLMRDGKY